MRLYLFFAFFLFLLWVILLLEGKRPQAIDLMDRTHTDILKGYAIFGVLLGHVGQYLGLEGVEFPAGVGVSLFLILSGYGIECSRRKNGLDRFWKKRLLRVYVPVALCDTVFILLKHAHVTWVQALLNYIFIKEIFPFMWYFRFIFISYLAYWFTFKLINDANRRLILLFSWFSFWFLIRSTVYIDSTPFLEPRQMFCFPIGVLVAYRIGGGTPEQKNMEPKIWQSVSALCISIALYALIHTPLFESWPIIGYNLIAVFTCMLCAFGIMGLVWLVPVFQNKGMTIVGSVSYEVYVIHRYFINDLGNTQSFMGLIYFVTATVAGSLVLYMFSTKVLRKIK